MKLSDISLPEVYMTNSADFRFFRRWFETCLSKVQYDIENLSDLYDPLRCKAELLWLLADTMGFKYDDRLPAAFNRLVLMYFMSMIRNRGSKDGVTLAAEVNLAQFNLLNYGKEKPILYDRLDDTSIPVNAVNVVPHTPEGYIDVIYFSDKTPLDACIEYVRPVGMYMFQQPGVRFDARTKISIDARLTDAADNNISAISTRVGHYSRNDYARLQKMNIDNEDAHEIDATDTRRPSWYRNSVAEEVPEADSGYRALYSLQLSNNEHIYKSLIDPIFGLGYTPNDVSTYDGPDTLPTEESGPGAKNWNLRYDKAQEESLGSDVYTVESTSSPTEIYPSVNPTMTYVGDAMSLDNSNIKYTKVDDAGNITIESYDSWPPQ